VTSGKGEKGERKKGAGVVSGFHRTGGSRPRFRSFHATAAMPQGRFMGLLLLIVLILLLVGGLPTWGHSRDWGYGPSGLVGLLLVVFVVLILMDVVQFGRF
jgi:hypothetical protein